MKICKINECTKPAKGRGWCFMHYARFRTTGDPLKTSRVMNMNPPTHCTFEGCNNKHQSKGWCVKHYTRYLRHGSPATTTRAPPGTVMKWLEKHSAYDENECLDWPFAKDHNGYGLATYKGQQKTASNVMCTISHGKPPTKKHECAHSCGNGHLACVNPKHLRWATKLENHADKHKHGTMLIGEKVTGSILKESQVVRIKKLKGKISCSIVANEYGVNPGTIYAIWSGRNWAWL